MSMPVLLGIALLLSVLLLAVGVLLLRFFLAVVTVQGPSMLPTLAPDDRVLVLRHWISPWIRKDQIVLMRLTPQLQARSEYAFSKDALSIKRIVAVGGETFIEKVSQQETETNLTHRGQKKKKRMWRVPARHVFLCGDNRAGSVDSRAWGPLPQNQIYGIFLRKLSSHASPETAALPPSTGEEERSWQPMLTAGAVAPHFCAPTVQGAEINLSDYQGQTLLILFTNAARSVGQYIASYKEVGLQAQRHDVILLFACEQIRERATRLTTEFGLSQPVIVAPRDHHPLFDLYHIHLLPAYCLIDSDGKILKTGLSSNGYLSWERHIAPWLPREAVKETAL